MIRCFLDGLRYQLFHITILFRYLSNNSRLLGPLARSFTLLPAVLVHAADLFWIVSN